jgi:SAM-dependent methyltransferase
MGMALDITKNAGLVLKPLRQRQASKALAHGYDSRKDEAGYVRSVFEKHSRVVLTRRDLSGDVVEIGPGGNVGVALLFLAAGASTATCVDEFPWVTTKLPVYSELAADADSLLDRLEYRLEQVERTTLPAASVDIIYSHACLEHVRDPRLTVRQIARLLRPGGVTSHQIDLRDHRDFAQPLAFLRYPTWAWTAAQSRRVWTNRWRRSDWEAAFRQEGLEVFRSEATGTVDVGDEARTSLSRQFRNRPLTDLTTSGLLIAARKPATE